METTRKMARLARNATYMRDITKTLVYMQSLAQESRVFREDVRFREVGHDQQFSWQNSLTINLRKYNFLSEYRIALNKAMNKLNIKG